MTYLVTGGAGFIGSNLVRRLAEMGGSVRVLDDLSTGSASNLAGVAGAMVVVEGDVRDSRAVRSAMEGTEIVFHLAALASVARSLDDPIKSHLANAEGTFNVLMAARDLGVRRVIYASSSSIYGESPKLPKVEDFPPQPISPYAASKLTGEAYCLAFSESYGLETVSLRFFNVFGPHQDPASEYAAVIPRFIGRMMEGLPPKVFGDGLQSRDFTYVDNVIDACVLASEAPSAVSGEALNIGCGGEITLLEVIGILNDLMESHTVPEFLAPRTGDVRHSRASIEKARRLLGYEPSISVRDGLAKTVGWFHS